MRLHRADAREGFGIKIENHRSFFQCFGEGEFELLAAQRGVHGEIGRGVARLNAAHAAIVNRPRQRKRNRVDGFTRHILSLRARLAMTKTDRPPSGNT